MSIGETLSLRVIMRRVDVHEQQTVRVVRPARLRSHFDHPLTAARSTGENRGGKTALPTVAVTTSGSFEMADLDNIIRCPFVTSGRTTARHPISAGGSWVFAVGGWRLEVDSWQFGSSV